MPQHRKLNFSLWTDCGGIFLWACWNHKSSSDYVHIKINDSVNVFWRITAPKTSTYPAGKTIISEKGLTCENVTFVAVGIHHLDLERGRRDLSAGGNCLIVTNCRMFLKGKIFLNTYYCRMFLKEKNMFNTYYLFEMLQSDSKTRPCYSTSSKTNGGLEKALFHKQNF